MLHQLTIVGTLGGDADLRYTPKGVAVCSFSVAATEYQGKNPQDGSPNYHTTWFKVTVWDKLAESVNPKLVKGAKVTVIGVLQSSGDGSPRMFERKDGTVGCSFEVKALNVICQSSTTEGRGSRGGYDMPVPEEDDVPF